MKRRRSNHGTHFIEHIDTIDSEGGPLIIGEPSLFNRWRGINAATFEPGAASDYAYAEQACGEQDGTILTTGDQQIVVWHRSGPGTADLFVTDTGIIVVRAWFAEDDDDDEVDDWLGAGANVNKVNTGGKSLLSKLPSLDAQNLSHSS